jgi:RNase P protein component
VRASLIELGEQIQPGNHLVFIARWRAKEASFTEIKKDIAYLTRKLAVRER